MSQRYLLEKYLQLDVQHNISVNTIKQGQQFLKHLHFIIVSGYFD